MDHRKYPEACYSLAYIYCFSGEISKAKTYYEKGLQAEDPKIRLPCFKPVEQDFPLKMTARMLIYAPGGMKMSMKNSLLKLC